MSEAEDTIAFIRALDEEHRVMLIYSISEEIARRKGLIEAVKL